MNTYAEENLPNFFWKHDSGRSNRLYTLIESVSLK